MSNLLSHLTKIGAVALAMASLDGLAQDDPNAAARADMESRIQAQPEQNTNRDDPPPSLTPNMSIVPGGTVTTPEPQPEPPPMQTPPQLREPQVYEGGNGGGRNPRPREEIFRNPDLNYRNRPPRRDDADRHPRPPRYRPPPIIIRPYYPPPIYVQPPVIVRPYIPPPFYDPPYVAPRRQWAGPVPRAVIWDQFPGDLYGTLPYSARVSHERAFIAALASDLGVTQTWRAGQLRGEITVIDEGYYGASFCRDVVQTIRTPWVERTADGRVCLKPGQSWRLVSY